VVTDGTGPGTHELTGITGASSSGVLSPSTVVVTNEENFAIKTAKPCDSYPHKPLVSYRINRQLSGWILPPLMILGCFRRWRGEADWRKPTNTDYDPGSSEKAVS
jgi:hypothetical protein